MDRQRGHLPYPVHGIEEAMPKLNLLSLGDAATGKSCLIKYYCEKKFVNTYISTIGIDYGSKRVLVPSSTSNTSAGAQEVKVHFWDASGDPNWRDVRIEFMQDAHAVMLVYHVGQRDTFMHIKQWLQEFQQATKSASLQATLFLVANQVDTEIRLVTAEEGKAYAAQNNMTYVETSAASGLHVDDLFKSIFEKTLPLLPVPLPTPIPATMTAKGPATVPETKLTKASSIPAA